MTMLILTKKEIEAVKASVEHWKVDILNPLLNGDVVVDMCLTCECDCNNCHSKETYYWLRSGLPVKYWGKYCALCRLVEEYCEKCPYFKKFRYTCDTYDQGGWSDFQQDPSIKSAKKMIRQLESILK